MVITLGQQYNVGEKPTVILYTYINRHAGTPTKGKTNCFIGNTPAVVTFPPLLFIKTYYHIIVAVCYCFFVVVLKEHAGICRQFASPPALRLVFSSPH